ncbi:ino80 chromatin remodeling complex protein [Ophiostoma piceae UAMH 11346]|uniref:Ino80 chromatin remodeling complex protein n=1 Tax=Ophiostoma piceae (strain UAMH 11346) TaxID=1262450 RepID=S3CSZ5_OPHP1|nr:ino80 chromatin remodeling complex protein [Ophiostoma piceae UAMH 11346]
MAGRAEARKVVEEMGKKNGYISPDLLDTMTNSLPSKDLEYVLQAMGNLKDLAAASVKTLAQNLYSSSAKLVFELLQNYDDNHYTNSARGPPGVAFSVYPDRILASCNEDGFTAANVTAICSVGQSSKKGGANGVGYTGEKGIGFKSVFMAAEEVHIQSGDYSFRFQYAKGDSGLGMTTPIWTEHDEQLDAQRSHILLTLRRDGKPGDVERRRALIREQFQTIHDTILLFLRNLEHIKVSFYDAEDVLTSVTSFSVDRQTNRTTVTKRTTAFEEDRKEAVTEIVKHYFMIKHIAHDLAPNENRTDLDGGEHAQPPSRSDGVVVLGFPMDAESVPVLQNEYIYAFLPVKQMGFKFLIHADFVTQANREDIVTTSERNLGLASCIADAFVQAVLWFRDHDTLQYTWMRYLPHDSDYPWDNFWQGVIRVIKDRLARTPVLRPANHNYSHRLIRDSRRLPNSMLDDAGHPLISDIDPVCYLSQEYRTQDLLLLQDYGLATMSTKKWLKLVQHDLGSPNSVIKSFKNQDGVDTRIADLLTTACTSSWLTTPCTSSLSLSYNVRQMVWQLELVPLRDGRWVSVTTTPLVYYPRVGGTSPSQDLEIPLQLDINVVEARAAARAAWKRLFDSLGVKAASVKLVRKTIFEKYRQNNFSFLQKSNFVAHLQFLYRSHHFAQSHRGYDHLYLLTRAGAVQWGTVDIYINDGDPYGVELLLPTDDGAPGLEPVYIMDDVYFDDEPSLPTQQSLPWKDWLLMFFRVRRHPRLMDAGGTRLSDICIYVAKHRPEKFLGFLQATWGADMPTPANQRHIIDELGRVAVLCRDGRKVRLDSTYFPLGNLEKLRSRFVANGFFPWLALEADYSQYEAFPPEWMALGEAFGLGYRRTAVDFLLDVLRYLADEHNDAESVESPERIYELYVRLQAEVRASSTSEEQANQIRLAFDSSELIFSPGNDTVHATWLCTDDCVWDAPVDLCTKVSLARLCDDRFPDLYSQDRSSLQSFFSRTLGVRDCNLEDLVDDIFSLKEPEVDFDTLNELYTCLFQWQEDVYKKNPGAAAENYSWLKNRFTEDSLICGFEDDVEGNSNADTLASWYAPAQCLWTKSTTRIPGMLTLNGLYPELRGFFVKGLGVKTMTAKMVYDKLLGPALTVHETKQTLETFNALLASGDAKGSRKDDMNAAAILSKPIFPVQMPGGGVQLCRGVDSFALVDRASLAQAFAGRAKLLDFDLEKVRVLQPFFLWAGLQGRGLSKMVKEISCIAGDDRRPITSRDRSIRHKARALFSLAIAYNSPRAQAGRQSSFYALLRSTETLETDKITSELHLHQDGHLVKVDRPAATFHIQDSATSLVVYVPRDETRQELCFGGTLPERFSTWLMTDPTTQISEPVPSDMVHAVLAVLCAKWIAMEAILDHHGITFVDVPDGETDDGNDGDDDENDATRDSDGHYTNNDGDDDDDEVLYITSMVARSSLSGPGVSGTPLLRVPRPSSNPADTTDAEDDGYPVLLDVIIQAARQASIPVHGTSEMSVVPQENIADCNVHRWLRDASMHERYKRIGAAGELFVFELLSRLESPLPGFSRRNWQSTIRDYAQQHATYADMAAWSGRETADITYEDVDGALTALLIEKGYLSSEVWSDARPRYYIEVKTTVNAAVETPFFMSNNQYTRMQDCSAGNGSHNNVYMIVRVFGLGAGFVGFKLLVDPDSMRRHHELEFTSPDPWSVVVL